MNRIASINIFNPLKIETQVFRKIGSKMNSIHKRYCIFAFSIFNFWEEALALNHLHHQTLLFPCKN
jgi:hypothetical protein